MEMNKMILYDKCFKYGTIILTITGVVILHIVQQPEAGSALAALLGMMVRTVFSSGEKELTEKGIINA
jgi:hypothetical protein